MEHQEKIAGLPIWVLVVGLGGAAVVAYLLFRNQGASSSSSTGATGYSSQGLAVMQNPDESATMSAQNQELSVLTQELAGIGGQVGDIGTNVTSGFSSVGTSLNGISGQLGSLANQDEANYQSMLTNISALGTADNAYYNSLLGSITTYANTLMGQNTQLSHDLAMDQAAQAAGFSNFAAVQTQQTHDLGTIMDWTNEIKARLQQGDYSAAEHGPSGQPWTTASSLAPGS
jgi:hypothetical protein